MELDVVKLYRGIERDYGHAIDRQRLVPTIFMIAANGGRMRLHYDVRKAGCTAPIPLSPRYGLSVYPENARSAHHLYNVHQLVNARHAWFSECEPEEGVSPLHSKTKVLQKNSIHQPMLNELLRAYVHDAVIVEPVYGSVMLKQLEIGSTALQQSLGRAARRGDIGVAVFIASRLDEWAG